jgi:hypothetical protein
MTQKAFLACKLLGAAVFLLSCLAFLPGFTPTAILLPLLALILWGGIFRLEKQVKEDCASRELFFRVFRHELMNHLQIISCLSQLGKQERLYQALSYLNEKLKIFGGISGLSSPVLMQVLGEFIFSLPGETSVTFHSESPFQAGDTLSAETARHLRSLTDCLRESRPKHVSLNISTRADGRFLEISAEANREGLSACLQNEKNSGSAYIRWQGDAAEEGLKLLVCSIPLAGHK